MMPLSRSVAPWSRLHHAMWCAWVCDGGRRHAGQAHPPSRSTSAIFCARLKSRAGPTEFEYLAAGAHEHRSHSGRRREFASRIRPTRVGRCRRCSRIHSPRRAPRIVDSGDNHGRSKRCRGASALDRESRAMSASASALSCAIVRSSAAAGSPFSPCVAPSASSTVCTERIVSRRGLDGVRHRRATRSRA